MSVKQFSVPVNLTELEAEIVKRILPPLLSAINAMGPKHSHLLFTDVGNNSFRFGLLDSSEKEIAKLRLFKSMNVSRDK
jgi:hypothetical protein